MFQVQLFPNRATQPFGLWYKTHEAAVDAFHTIHEKDAAIITDDFGHTIYAPASDDVFVCVLVDCDKDDDLGETISKRRAELERRRAATPQLLPPQNITPFR